MGDLLLRARSISVFLSIMGDLLYVESKKAHFNFPDAQKRRFLAR